MLRFLRKIIINRSFTQFISYIIDNYLPPVIRDNRYFMYLFFYLAYKGKNVKYYMNFKSSYYNLDNSLLEKLYQDYNTIGTERKTDLNNKSILYMIENLLPGSSTILDVACGRGYLVNKFTALGFKVTGADLFEENSNMNFTYIKANIENLPFKDNSFDIVSSTHTLEHVIDIKKAVNEIKRIAKKQIVVVVPCQRFYFYTLDLHIHFFPKKEMLINLIGLTDYKIKKVGGDWVYVGNII